MALTNNMAHVMGSLGPLRARKHPSAPALWDPEPDFHSASVAGTTFEGSPIHFKFSLSVGELSDMLWVLILGVT